MKAATLTVVVYYSSRIQTEVSHGNGTEGWGKERPTRTAPTEAWTAWLLPAPMCDMLGTLPPGSSSEPRAVFPGAHGSLLTWLEAEGILHGPMPPSMGHFKGLENTPSS